MKRMTGYDPAPSVWKTEMLPITPHPQRAARPGIEPGITASKAVAYTAWLSGNNGGMSRSRTYTAFATDLQSATLANELSFHLEAMERIFTSIVCAQLFVSPP